MKDAGIDEWEKIQQSVIASKTLTDTDRTAIIRARRGQGLFKQNVMRVEEERLDGENGLLLTPTMDHLFDRRFIAAVRERT